MERRLKMFVSIFYLAVVGFRQSSGSRLLGNDIFVIGLRNPSSFYSNLNAGAGLPFSDFNSSEPSDEALKVCGDNMKESPQAEEFVLNVARKGRVTPSGNAMENIQQLSTSTPSPGVGHMQIRASIPKSLPRSHQKRVAKKRILQSTPSPGGGH